MSSYGCSLVLLALQLVSDESVLRPGETITGRLADGDPTVVLASQPTGGQPVLGVSHPIVIDEAGSYTIELHSFALDSYLVLRDAGGSLLAEDDDGLVGLDARLELNLTPDEQLSVQVCGLRGTRGEYELTLRSGSVPAPSGAALKSAELAFWRRHVEVLESQGHAELSVATRRLGQLLRGQGLFPEAQVVLQRLLAQRTAALGTMHPALASTLTDIASVFDKSGDLGAARAHLELALKLRRTVGESDVSRLLGGMANLATVMGSLGEHVGALTLMEEAVELCERALGLEHPGLALCLAIQADQLEALGDHQSALTLLERSLSIRQASFGSGHVLVSSTLGDIAALHHELGNLEVADVCFEQARSSWEQAPGAEPAKLANILHSHGRMLSDLGAVARARSLLERALEIREAVSGPESPRLASVLGALAGAEAALGNLPRARSLLERSLSLREAAMPPDHGATAADMNSLALLLRDVGDLVGARTLLERSLELREELYGPMHPAMATIHNSLGLLLKDLGDLPAARRAQERALTIVEEVHGACHARVASALNNLATVVRAQGDDQAARALHERALACREALLGADHPTVASSLAHLASLDHEQGLTERSILRYRRSLAIRLRVFGDDHPLVTAVLNAMARLSLDMGDAAAARAAVEAAMTGERQQLALLLGGFSEAEEQLVVNQLLHQLELRLSPAFREVVGERAAYEGLLNWKGQVLRALSQGRQRRLADLNAEDQQRLERLNSVQTTMARLLLETGGDRSESAAAQLELLIAERLSLERALEQQAIAPQATSPTWDHLVTALPEGAALVDLFVHRSYEPQPAPVEQMRRAGRWGAPRMSAWITRAGYDAPMNIDLGPVKLIEQAVAAFHADLRQHRGTSLARPADSGGAAVRRLVWDRLAAALEGVSRVFVSPDGVLGTLPLAVLRDDDGRFLIESWSFVTLTDPTTLVTEGARLSLPHGARLLAVGGIDYFADLGERSAASALGSEGGAASAAPLSRGPRTDVWEPLYATSGEALRVASRHRLAFPDGEAVVLRGAAASEEALKQGMPGSSVLHLATHAYLEPQAASRRGVRLLGDPPTPSVPFVGVTAQLDRARDMNPDLLSGLVCAGVNRGPQPGRDDGYLTTAEVAWLDLSGCELAVLSACDTGLGRPQSGEGLLGLRRAFLVAGSRSVISSLWSVGDEATAQLMDVFYSNLWQRGLGKADALRQAQLTMIARARAAEEPVDPHRWGAFVLDGDWR